ncbi:undecaprenyldiphospho-muramoylpentapeptide beta-N-acetylglucosaminyltransferase [Blattabacterium cuenoti]|uniref:undecaprenyldiphospho-muramoylpentapeptide beta-N-acetylglucosaminyltransferase n=1 Tax=Blattabacterium cuenoti TaxID=1653831 RepID=UPI00163C571F|nr:undecaprenyldiphospho-muramoylpentapeptide beta-N-acetylglucosaminyltransferase [Blattabacterium cuenoti]
MKKKKIPKIIIGSGGTCGHIYPGIAIAEELSTKVPKSHILFIGSKNHMEMQEIPKFGYLFEGIRISGGKNKFCSIVSGMILSMELIYSFFLIKKIFNKFCPDIVIGTGGFVSFPTLYAAHKCKIPILLQEQNSFPGFTNRIFSRYARKICVAYNETKKNFPKKIKHNIITTGNPIRSEIMHKILLDKKQACLNLGLNVNKPIILSIGGSQGAHSINMAWINGLNKLINLDIQLIWQVGKIDIIKISKNINFYHKNIIIMDFIENIRIYYSAADIVVSRAGGLTISEISLIGKPFILIPLPFASDDHQNKNAKMLEEQDAALIINNEEIEQKLVDATIDLLNDSIRQNRMIKNILKLGKPKATYNIVKEISHIIDL